MKKIVLAMALLLTSSLTLAQEGSDLYSILENNPTPSEAATTANANSPQVVADTSTTDASTTKANETQEVIEVVEVVENKPPTIREEAFKQLLNKTLPMKPEQLMELHRTFDKNQQAVQATPNAPPQPISSTLTVDLSPGTTPPVIRLAAGFVTSLVFVDSTGQPWPISDYSLGNPANFNIQWDKKTNALFLQSTTAYVTANLAVRLGDLETPIMLSLVTGQKEVDYRIDLQIRARGPNALAPIVDNIGGSSAPPSLLSVLDGVPPSGSVELKVSNNHGRAWLYNGNLIFRTKLTLLSPAWKNSVSSLDGTKVYELMETPLILASQQGKPVHIELSGM